VKVLDFGIARTADAVTLTQTASVLGTAPYMAPEQAMGNPADARSDIYSLGCVLYEMLTGQPPFMADVPAAVLHQHVRVPVKPPRELNPAVPPGLDALVVQMLAKKPEDRPQTAAEVRDRLAAFDTGAATEPTVALTAAPVTAATEVLASAAAAAAVVPQVATVPQPASAPPQTAGATRPLPPPRKKSGGPWAFLAVVALALLCAAVAYALATGGGSSSSHTSSSVSHPSAPAATSSHQTSHSTAQSESTPSTSPSTPSTSSSTSTTSTTTTTTTLTTTATSPPGPPGQGGAPPGQAKKDKHK
jgi:serine/threonine-protein kinase